MEENHKHWIVVSYQSYDSCPDPVAHALHSEEEAYEYFISEYVPYGLDEWEEEDPDRYQLVCDLIEKKQYAELLELWNEWQEPERIEIQ